MRTRCARWRAKIPTTRTPARCSPNRRWICIRGNSGRSTASRLTVRPKLSRRSRASSRSIRITSAPITITFMPSKRRPTPAADSRALSGSQSLRPPPAIMHMPSHIYFRIGDYDASVNANLAAIKADKVYLRERNPKGMFTMNYVAHNDAFLWASYMMEGNSRGAFKASRALDDALPLDLVRQMPMAEGVSPSRYFTEARFGKWDEILKELAPPADLTYTTAIWHYARGLALAAKNRPGDAQKEQDKLDEIIAATPLGRTAGFNPANRLLALAAATLAGEIASANGNHDEAIKQLQQAVAIQDALNYDEPPDWYYPVRETLGMELLADGKTAEAEEVFREDLKRSPENGWSLNGLAICLRARNASDEATSVEARLKKAWAHADVTLPASAAPEKTTAAR